MTKDIKKPYLFYYEDAVDAWVPCDGIHVENIIDVATTLDVDEEMEIRFKRFDMTDEEFNSIPED